MASAIAFILFGSLVSLSFVLLSFLCVSGRLLLKAFFVLSRCVGSVRQLVFTLVLWTIAATASLCVMASLIRLYSFLFRADFVLEQ